MELKLAPDGLHSIETIAPDTFRIDENGLVNAYLLLGKDKALLIDSGVGVGNIYECVRSLTDLPIVLALTHRHCDHDGGVNYFREYYCHRNDRTFANDVLSSRLACRILLKFNKQQKLKLSKKPYHSHPRYLEDDTAFDLGGRVIRYVLTPGHTHGSVVYLDDQTNFMFTGDDINTFLFLQIGGATTVSEWLPGAKEILKLADKYKVFAGHIDGRVSKEEIAGVISLGERLLLEKPKFKKKYYFYPEDQKAPIHIVVNKKTLK